MACTGLYDPLAAPGSITSTANPIDIEKWDGSDWFRVSSFTLDMVRQTEEQMAAVSGAPAG